MSIAGEFVSETFDYDGGRLVTAYVPPDPPEAIVFDGDGQMISWWGLPLEGTDLPPTMIVGAHRVSDETLRLHEYFPKFDPNRFAAHERFFVGDLGDWVRSRFGVALPADRTAVFGVSAGGELALAIGLRHADLYGAIFSALARRGIPAARRVARPIASDVPRAGTGEPFSLENAARWATALREAGADVVLMERAAGHADARWRDEFPLMVAWAFSR
jgi:pimeloyl-ACP methyl ester carboxylesterase